MDYEKEFNIFSNNINQAARSFYYHLEIDKQTYDDGIKHENLAGGYFHHSRIYQATNSQFWIDFQIEIDTKERTNIEERKSEPTDRTPVNREDPKVEKLYRIIHDLWAYSEETQYEIINSYFKYKEIPLHMLIQRPEDILQY